MIMLKTLSEDLAPVCVLSDNYKLNMETAATTYLSKYGLKFPTTLATTAPSSKPFCKDALLQLKSDMLPGSKQNSDSLDGLQHIPLTDSQRAMLHLAKSKAEAEAASMQNNLFQAGFQDCATEVIRFLMDQENLDNGNPLIQGLQSHLSKMSNTICSENIADLDLSPSSQTISTDCSPLISSSIVKDTSVGYFSTHSLNPQQSQPLSQSSLPSSELTSSSSRNLSPIEIRKETSHVKRKRSSTAEITEQTPPKRICQNSITAQEPALKLDAAPVHESTLLPYLPQPLEQSSHLLLSSSSSSSSSSLTTPTMTSFINTKPSSSSSSSTPTHTTTTPSSSSPSSSSILELKAHFLPGIDTNSMASGNFADILLAVESCQSHENPRVRELADTIINLIHNNDDDDDDEYDDEEEEDEQENNNDNVDEIGAHGDNDIANVNANTDTQTDTTGSSTEHEDSGIDLGEDWCNPADMIEC